MTDQAWTLREACEEFAKAGVPIDPDPVRAAYRLHLIIRGLQLEPAGRGPSAGEQGGRGQNLYPISELQRLHAALAPWLVPW